MVGLIGMGNRKPSTYCVTFGLTMVHPGPLLWVKLILKSNAKKRQFFELGCVSYSSKVFVLEFISLSCL